MKEKSLIMINYNKIIIKHKIKKINNKAKKKEN